MENSFWSIDDFINWRCAPDEDFMPALEELRQKILAGKVEITGWQCSWSPYGLAPRFRSDRKRETIPVLDVVDLVFDCLPDWEVVLVSQRFHAPRPDASYTELHGYGDFLDVRIDGWEKLYLRGEQVRAAYGETTSKTAAPPSKLIKEEPNAPSKTRRRGPRPEKREAVVAIMRHRIAKGTVTVAALRDEKEEVLATEYSASRDTVRRARAEVLNSDKQRQTSTSDK